MSGRKNWISTALPVLAVMLVTAALTVVSAVSWYRQEQFRALDGICSEIMKRQPETEAIIWGILKEYKDDPARERGNILSDFGYQASDFVQTPYGQILLFAGVCFGTGTVLLGLASWYGKRRQASRVGELANYLEKVNAGENRLLLPVTEDAFSKLQDEIYKTVTTLNQSKDAAVAARTNYGNNLSNIAHQLKTPITAISLSTQMMKEQPSLEYPIQIQKQINRLNYLEEALLLLARIEAGTLLLKPRTVDVFTLLMLSADNLQELSLQTGVLIDVQEMGEAEITADLDWTMEAIMNLLKNGLEHTPKGKAVHCAYEQNPLYTQIRIWDEGPGFIQEDLPHLFERFYRGKEGKESGIGIGLSLAKEILEMQSGVISAGNLAKGGAYFEIRLYSH